MTRTLLVTLGLLATLAGCASQTVYQPAASRGSPGYTETRLSPGRYRIVFTGNSSTPKDTVQDYALLRAAELSLQEGYDWFRLADRDVEKKVRESTTVDSAYVPPRTRVYQSCGLLACQTTVVEDPGWGLGLGTATTTTTATYTAQLEIIAGRKPKPAGNDIYDARDVAQSIRERMPKPR
ncbi:MAG TPA: hypothetical protein VFV11_06140 [Solimonas sp.]|nr:hypothetical protein [Solimonas sp.]